MEIDTSIVEKWNESSECLAYKRKTGIRESLIARGKSQLSLPQKSEKTISLLAWWEEGISRKNNSSTRTCGLSLGIKALADKEN